MKAATVKLTGVQTWQLLKLAGEAKLDPRTVALVLQGKSGDNRRQQVREAAARLNMELPMFDETGRERVRST